MVTAACAYVTYTYLHAPPTVDEYDYVVVGAGSAGSIVAARLAQKGFSVLLLESGRATQASLGGRQYVAGHWTIFDIPLEWLSILKNPRWREEFEWHVPADPAPAIARGLGGCSIHNAMLYVRGVPSDFDYNASATHDVAWPPEWNSSLVWPYYLRC